MCGESLAHAGIAIHRGNFMSSKPVPRSRAASSAPIARSRKRIRHAIGTAAVILATLAGSAGAQSFTENFDNITLLTANGWFLQNNSAPVGSTSWFQGNNVAAGGPFDSYNGAANAYIGANFNSTTGGSGIISTWLLTPNRTFRNGDVLRFYTRKPATPPNGTDYPDRLEVRLSTNGASTNVGSPGASFGDFSILMLSVNPTLAVGGYPYTWTQYTVFITGLPAPASGRMAFRYFVTGAGPSGANSDYIGIDNAVYTPYVCPAVTLTPAGGALSSGAWGQAYAQALSQTGALGAPSFAVIAGALPPGLELAANGTISGTPTATGTFNFSVSASDASGCSGSQAYSITVNTSLPSVPQDVVAVAGDAEVVVNWSAPASDGGDSALTYDVSCAGGNTVSGTGLPPVTLSGLVNGTAYTCAVAASNSAGQGAFGTSNTVTPMGNQAITFDAQAGQTYSPGGAFAIDPLAVASSGLDVVYGSTTPSVCVAGGASVSILAAGTCTITADQPGDAAWNPALQVEQSLTIAQAGQTLTFPTQAETQRWFHTGATFEISPLATSTEPNSGETIVYSSLTPGVCSVSGTTVAMLSGGLCTLAADQAGNANYSAATQATTSVSIEVPTVADLWIQSTVDETRPSMGDTVTFTITVGNDGEADTAGVGIQDLVPDRLDPATVAWQCTAAVGSTCPTPDQGTGALDVAIAWMPKDSALTFTLSGEVSPAADPANDYDEFFNTVTVSLSSGTGLTDPAGNNSSTIYLRVDDTLFEDGFESPEP